MPNDLLTNLYNPDVLSCLANLSNDEVFTPPSVANEMLDMLPQALFADPKTTFLDPACKSGVFLREIAKRLIAGLENVIPDLQERIDHIFHKQIYAIAITELTSLLSRRSTYCSKYPNGDYSVTRFADVSGNIRYKKIQHVWKEGRCVFCGANKGQYDRNKDLESHAYEFIHTVRPEEINNMKFDVIIGNPPYHLSDGSGNGAGAMPIYQKFVQQSIKLKPRYLSMIIPARWYSGGRGLDAFRNEMLKDSRIRVIHDFMNASDCFQGVQIEGGVCYFLWDRDNCGLCKVYTHVGSEITSSDERPLLEEGTDSFIRNSTQISILRKVRKKAESSFADIVSANDPFGYDVRVKNSYLRIKPEYQLTKFKGAVAFYYYGWQKDGLGYVKQNSIRKGADYIDKWKVYISQAYGMGNSFPTQVINKPFVGEPNSCCTETYILVGPFDDERTAKNACSYMSTRFFRFLVMFKKNTQHATQTVYQFVPIQDLSKAWTDDELFKKYGLTEDEVAFIESTIRPME